MSIVIIVVFIGFIVIKVDNLVLLMSFEEIVIVVE